MGYILIVTAVYLPEPVVSARISEDLYQSLKREGHAVKILHPAPSRPNGFGFGKNIQYGVDEVVTDSFTCPQSSLLGRFKESYSFGKACSQYIKEHYKEISAIYANAWPMPSQHMIVKSASKYGIPVIMHVQDVYPESLSNKLPSRMGYLMQKALLPYDRKTLAGSSRVVAISEKMKRHLVETRGLDADKISVVINWQDESEFLDYQKQNDNSTHDIFTFMYMGNIGPVAGVDLLIDAFSHIDLPNTRLVIAGSGSMKDSLIEKAKNNSKIEFWDVPNGKVPEIQSKTDVMLLPIKKGAASSSIPSKLPAYMFSAKPIIGCMDADSDTEEAIRESRGGYVIEPENPQALSDMMRKMVSMKSEALNAMGLSAQQYALSHFSKKANLEKLVQVVESVL